MLCGFKDTSIWKFSGLERSITLGLWCFDRQKCNINDNLQDTGFFYPISILTVLVLPKALLHKPDFCVYAI